ncbi:MAG: hypothetical protein J7L23_00500 [Candidatus Diapherotrites archaeon]|nr:hypothetical protein [Candidatus Diapherotrites archaeon]
MVSHKSLDGLVRAINERGFEEVLGEQKVPDLEKIVKQAMRLGTTRNSGGTYERVDKKRTLDVGDLDEMYLKVGLLHDVVAELLSRHEGRQPKDEKVLTTLRKLDEGLSSKKESIKRLYPSAGKLKINTIKQLRELANEGYIPEELHSNIPVSDLRDMLMEVTRSPEPALVSDKFHHSEWPKDMDKERALRICSDIGMLKKLYEGKINYLKKYSPDVSKPFIDLMKRDLGTLESVKKRVEKRYLHGSFGRRMVELK